MPAPRPELLAGAVLYIRQGCHLCEQFLLELGLEFGESIEDLRIVDVDRDVDLAVRFGLRVPVLAIDDEVVCEAVYDAAQVRRSLAV
jgi:siroheme synthase (precorrin-2 oxidase/ferrochelatase)